MTDITQLIREDHETFRADFAALWELPARGDSARLEAAWTRLANRLETHARAEEDLLYPALLVRAGEDASQETVAALRDHNAIRMAVERAGTMETGSDDWREAVRRCQAVNDEHVDEEERDILPDARQRIDGAVLATLGTRWTEYMHEHAQPGEPRPVDPSGYVEALSDPQD